MVKRSVLSCRKWAKAVFSTSKYIVGVGRGWVGGVIQRTMTADCLFAIPKTEEGKGGVCTRRTTSRPNDPTILLRGKREDSTALYLVINCDCQ